MTQTAVQDHQRSSVQPFTNHLPVRIRFGDGAADTLTEIATECGVRRVLVITDVDLEHSNPPAARCIAGLEATGAAVARHVKSPGEPTISTVDAAAEAIGGARADAVVAIGGGSVIDTAKAARLCAQLGCTFAEFIASRQSYPEPTLPLIALPTTAGTGSEVSGGAVISDPDSGSKSGIADANLRPQYAVVDPVLSHTMPPTTTLYTGVDALAQAIAATIARVRTPIGDAIALEAVRLVGGSLITARRDGSDAQARSQMACASLMAGLAMNVSDCTAEHSMGQAIGGLFDVPHGLTVGLVLVETLERERQYVPKQLERVADALGAPSDHHADGRRAVSAVRDLLARLQFPVLTNLGVTEAHLPTLTQMTLKDFFITQAPEPWTESEIREAFNSALATTERAQP